MGKKATLYLLYWISFALTLILAIFTVIAGKFNPYFPSGIFSIGALMLPVLLIINLIVAIYWLIRRRWFFLVSVLAVISNYDYLGTIYRSGEPIEENSLYKKVSYYNTRIATLNAGRFGAEDFKPIFKGTVSYLKEMNIDIICFQEYNQSWDYGEDSIKAKLSDYPYSFIPKNLQGNFDVALFSKFPIMDVSYHQYKFSNYGYIKADLLKDTTLLYDNFRRKINDWVNYDSDKGTITDSLYALTYKRASDSLYRFVLDSLKSNNHIANNQIIRLFTTHFESTGVSPVRSTIGAAEQRGENLNTISLADVLSRNLIISDSIRRVQAKAIKSEILKSPYNVILCGDFNDTPSSYIYKTFADTLTDGFITSGIGYMYTFNGLKKALRIDYIFASPSLHFVRYFSQPKSFSDHNPVIAEISFNQ